MKKIIDYIKSAFKEDFNLLYYLITAILIITLFILNYKYDLRSNLIDIHFGTNYHYFAYSIFIATPYFLTFFIASLTKKDFSVWKNKNFWILSLVAMSILTLNGGSKNLIYEMTRELNFSYKYYDWASSVISNFHRLIVLIIPLALFYFLFDKKNSSKFYGFKISGFDYKPYLIMLLIMIPLIFAASFSSSFLKTYPLYKPGSLESSGELSSYITIGVFEFFYALRFIAVEHFFRGFLSLRIAEDIGYKILLPVTVTYAIWHFGKPMGEAIGSIFGAYILAIIAIRTKSIIGGILIHMGVALLMELAAHLQLI